MKTFLSRSLACAGLGALLLSGATAASRRTEIDAVPGTPAAAVQVVPVVRLDPASDMIVRLAFETSSERPVRYLFRNDRLPVDLVYFHLLRDGKIVPRREDEPLRPLAARRVRELRRGERLVHSLDLREHYGALKPGLYTLEVHASGGPRDFDLSQITLNDRILHLEIAGEGK